MLPRWRGAAPIQRAILAGDRETGVTIMQMDAGLDTGAMLLAQAVLIAADDTAQSLHDKLAATGAQLLLRVLQEQPQAVAQDNACATYAAKISKAEAHIDWTRPAVEIDRLIRAFNPAPGAYTTWNGQALKIWRAEPATAVSGTVAGTVVLAPAPSACSSCSAPVANDWRRGSFWRAHPSTQVRGLKPDILKSGAAYPDVAQRDALQPALQPDSQPASRPDHLRRSS